MDKTWGQCQRRWIVLAVGRPLHGGVDRNPTSLLRVPRSASRPLHGGVDRNVEMTETSWIAVDVAPFTGAWIETFRDGHGDRAMNKTQLNEGTT